MKAFDWIFGTAPRREEAPTNLRASDGTVIPSRATAPRIVSVGDALSVSYVFRAIQILAVSGKQLAIDTFRNGLQIDDADLCRRPDPFISRSAWIDQTITSLASTGNAYWRIVRDSSDQVRALPVLNPLDVVIKTDSFGRVTGYEYRGDTFRPSEIKHLVLRRIPGSVKGLGPIQAAQEELRGVIDTRDYATTVLTSGGQPTGILTSEQVLTPEQAKQYKDRFNETSGAKNGVAVLGQGMTYSPVFLSPKDVQFIESQQFSVATVARMFGIPSSLMLVPLEGKTQTYANVEQDWLGYVRFTWMDYGVEIEDALSDMLPGRQRARFNIESLLRADTTTRYAAYSSATGGQPFLTVDEIREIEHLSPLNAAQEATANV